jgi:hypothetical protein
MLWIKKESTFLRKGAWAGAGMGIITIWNHGLGVSITVVTVMPDLELLL